MSQHDMTAPDGKVKAKIISLRRDHGLSFLDLSARFGKSTGTIRKILADAGLANAPKEPICPTRSCFAAIEAAAVAGTRCPTRESLPGGSKAVSQLCRDGEILVEVFVHNFRQVTLLVGEHRGKKTAPPPLVRGRQAQPYLVVGRATYRNGAIVTPGQNRRCGLHPRKMVAP